MKKRIGHIRLKKIPLLIAALLLVSCGWLVTSCVEEYWPDLGLKYENAVVVDGMITNDPGPYTVTLSRSSSVSQPAFLPLVGCEVSIMDNLGNSEILKEESDGIYRTSPNGIQGEVGISYKLSIQTPNGRHYESEYAYLSPPTTIDSIYYLPELKEVVDADHPTNGLQFYINTGMAEQDTNYYLWRLESSFKFEANHRVMFIFDGTMERFFPSDSLLTCWWTGSAKEIFTYSTEKLSQPVIRNFPLNYVDTETKMLSIRYSLLVNQLSITKAAHKFWNSLSEMESESGSMFSRQPYQVRGNVRCLEDDDEPVLGYFMVAGKSSKRIFVDRPSELDFFYSAKCNLITQELYTLLWGMVSSWPVLLAGQVTENGYVPALTSDQGCVDCREEYNGATLQQPDFWIE
jgi:hypothetical protein